METWNWPSLKPEDVAAQRRRTARKQERCALDIARYNQPPSTGLTLGNASNRAIGNSAKFLPLHRTDDAASLTSFSSSSRSMPQRPVPKGAAVRWNTPVPGYRRSGSPTTGSHTWNVRQKSGLEFGTAGMEVSPRAPRRPCSLPKPYMAAVRLGFSIPLSLKSSRRTSQGFPILQKTPSSNIP